MKLAIIGASTGQKALYMKAKEMGYTTLSFAWPQGAVCKDLSDKYYPISIFEMDRIVDVCGDEYIEGVVSNGSDLTAKVAAYISEMLHLNGNSYQTIINIQDKLRVREQSVCIDGLSQLWYYRYDGHQPPIYPCVCKPAVGGVNLAFLM